MKRPLSITCCILYSSLLPCLVFVGFGREMHLRPHYPGNALNLPAGAILLALALLGCAAGLHFRQKWSLYGFYLVTPLASFAPAMIFAHELWRDDIPMTCLLAIVYLPLAFLGSRPSALAYLGIQPSTWRSRGGAALLAGLAVAVVAGVVVQILQPSASSFGDDFAYYREMGRFVRSMAICIIIFANYLGAFLAVVIPPRRVS